VKANIKRRWIRALRSGRYTQGTGALHDDRSNTYCCLGVLSQIVNKKRPKPHYTYTHRINNTCDGAELSPKFMKKVGLDVNIMDILIRMNDENRLNFEQIADWLEENKV